MKKRIIISMLLMVFSMAMFASNNPTKKDKQKQTQTSSTTVTVKIFNEEDNTVIDITDELKSEIDKILDGEGTVHNKAVAVCNLLGWGEDAVRVTEESWSNSEDLLNRRCPTMSWKWVCCCKKVGGGYDPCPCPGTD
jgi:hypothetical protein